MNGTDAASRIFEIGINDRLPPGQLLILGLQNVFGMTACSCSPACWAGRAPAGDFRRADPGGPLLAALRPAEGVRIRRGLSSVQTLAALDAVDPMAPSPLEQSR
jgi:hypothetical protein